MIRLSDESANAIDRVVDELRSVVRALTDKNDELERQVAQLSRENGELLDELNESREAQRRRADLELEGY